MDQANAVRLLWIVIGLFGLSVVSWNLWAAIEDRRWLRRTGKNGLSEVIAASSIRGEIVRAYIEGVIVVSGVALFLTRGSTPAADLTRVLFATVAAVVAIDSMLAVRDRQKILRMEARDLLDPRPTPPAHRRRPPG